MRKPALTAFLAFALSVAAFASEEISVVVSGKYYDPIPAYKVGPARYLSARQAAGLYGAQVYWYPVSGRLLMSLRGRRLQFLANSDAVKSQDRTFRLESPMILRASQAYIPLSFFLSEEFSSWAASESSFNARTRLLTVDRRSTVGPVRWFSYRDYTRISVELGRGLVHSSSARGVLGVSLAVPLGTVESSEEAEIADGVVDSISLRQGPKSALLSVKLSRPGIRWRAKEFSDPRRVVLDFLREGSWPQASAEGGPSSPAPEPSPARAPVPSAEEKPSAAPPVERPARRRRVVIDAGHGGKDGGATGRRGTLEKDINLLAARELAGLLKEEEAFEVLLTRSNDSFVPLDERARLANDFGADLFISLHANASRSPRDSGFEVYFLSERASDPEAERLAQVENSVLELEGKSAPDDQAKLLLREMTKTENINAASELAGLIARALSRRVSLQNRGVKQAAFYVLRGTHAPAVLFEMAYLTNRKDETMIESRKFRRKLVEGLYAGVLDYAKRQGWISASN